MFSVLIPSLFPGLRPRVRPRSHRSALLGPGGAAAEGGRGRIHREDEKRVKNALSILEMHLNPPFSTSNQTELSNIELESNQNSRVELRTKPNFLKIPNLLNKLKIARKKL